MRPRDARRRIRARRVYRLLVWLYPAAHRRAFGEQMVQTFGDHYRDVVQERGQSRWRFWLAVLADVATSLRTEHAAEIRTRVRRPRGRRGRGGRLARPSGINRRGRVRRRPRYGRPARRRVRVEVRTRRHRLVYRPGVAGLAVTVVLAGAGFGVGTATAHLGMSLLVTGLIVVAWLGYGLRLTRPVPAGRYGNGPTSPGGAGVREPRRPLPMSPAGSAARPRPDEDPPGQAVALI